MYNRKKTKTPKKWKIKKKLIKKTENNEETTVEIVKI